MSPEPNAQPIGHVSSDEIKAVLGAVDEAALLEIVALRPTIRDLEEAVTWLSGDRDIFGAGEPLKDVAAEIVAILTANEEDEESRSR
jgi:hypothetical protein